MNISLTPELEKFVQEKVEGGMYVSVSEVIRESLRLLHAHEHLQKQRLKKLDQAISVGMTQLKQKQQIEGEESRARMKRQIDALARRLDNE